MYRIVAATLLSISIFVAASYYLLLLKLNDFEDPLLNAAYAGELQSVEKLLASGKNNIDYQDAYSNCALTVAIYGRNNDVVHYLLDKGAKTEIKSAAPPLHLAIDTDQLAVFSVVQRVLRLVRHRPLAQFWRTWTSMR